MIHVGAELYELGRGTCTLAVDRRPELLQQHACSMAASRPSWWTTQRRLPAATSRGQAALTAEYKLNLLSPASGERLNLPCARDQARRQVAVVAADVSA